jgi:hypothetical protein
MGSGCTMDNPPRLSDLERFAARLRAEVLEEALNACDDVEEPAWYGYECPNTFQDGQWACLAAIRALKQP